MKNTIDLTENRVFRDKKPERSKPSLWKNYGNKDSQMNEYKEALKVFGDSLQSFIDSNGNRYTLSSTQNSYTTITTVNSTGFSDNRRVFSFSYVNNDSQLNNETYYVMDTTESRRPVNYITLSENGEWLMNSHKLNQFLGIIGATETIREYIRKQLPKYKPLKFKEKDDWVKHHLEIITPLLRGANEEPYKGSTEYPFDLPEYALPMETPFHRRMRVFSSRSIRDKSIILRGLWRNYKYGEKNPLNTWNLDPDFLDEEIKMPNDTHFMDHNPNMRDYIEGIN